MPKQKREEIKTEFKQALTEFVETLKGHISTPDDQWTIKGFIDVFRNIYTISADTKIVSKILEIHLFPKLLEFANPMASGLLAKFCNELIQECC